MSVCRKIKLLSIKLYNGWSYLILTGLAAFVTFFKVFAYAQLLDDNGFAILNYFYTYVFIFLLVLGIGVINRAHVEFAKRILAGSSKEELNILSSQFKLNILLHTAFTLIVSIAANYFYTFDYFSYLVYALIFSTLFLFFLIDIILIKSQGLFADYGRKLLTRNIFIFLFGVSFYLTTGKVNLIAISEVIAIFIIYINGMRTFISNFSLPNLPFIKESIKFLPVSGLAVLLSVSDRLIAISIFDSKSFALFSYFALLLTITLNIQGNINTKYITTISAVYQQGFLGALLTTLKTTVVVFLVQLLVLLVASCFLFSPYVKPAWVVAEVSTIAVFGLFAAIKGSDFLSGLCLVSNNKKLMFYIQLTVLVLMFVCYYMVGLSGLRLHDFAIIFSVFFIMYQLFLFLALYFKQACIK